MEFILILMKRIKERLYIKRRRRRRKWKETCFVFTDIQKRRKKQHKI